MPFDAGDFATFRVRTKEQEAKLKRLRKGRARIARGWCQDVYSEVRADHKAMSYCMIGALIHGNSLDGEGDAEILLLPFLPADTPAPYKDSVSLWNDTSDRTQEEVLAVFDRAIAAFEGTPEP